MQDFIDDFVELVEDLVDLRVVSVAVGRLSALLQGGGGGARDYNVEMLESRRGVLEKLSQKLTGQSADASELGQLSPTSQLYDADPQEEFDADLYVPEEVVYYDPSERSDAAQIPGGAQAPGGAAQIPGGAAHAPGDADQVPEDPAQAPENAAQAPQDVAEAPEDSASPVHTEVKAANSFFNELFPTEAVTKQHQLDGSFPDFADFNGGIDCVGSGFSGLVFKSTLRGVPVGLKVSKAKSEAANRADYTEWSVSERLNPHPNVLQVVGLCPSFGRALSQKVRAIAFGDTVIDTTAIGTTAIVSPWQENGALRKFYDSETRIRKDDDLQNAALGMIRGVRSLHEQGVVHRDIAVRNFLVDIDGRVMLCDFGLTRSIPDGKKQIDLCNTPEKALLPWRYLAPECFDGIYSTASDMWMYGVSLVELVKGTKPWQDIERPPELRKAMKTRELELPDMAGFPEIIASIVRDCLQFEPSMRPTANDVAERLVRWQFRAMDLDRDDKGNTPLHRAVSSADDSGVQLLDSQIPAMVNAVNNLGETPLMLAKDSIFVERLLGYRKVPSSNEEPSRIAEYYHNIDAFGTLWKLTKMTSFEQIKLIGTYGNLQGTDLDERVGPNGKTPLHVAAKLGNIELFDALVGLNVISVWKSDNDLRTALHVASQHEHVVIMEKLVALTHESDEKSEVEVHRVNMQDKTGKTALHLAAASGNASAVRVLLDCSATNVNLRDFDGRVQMFDVTLAIDADVLSWVEVLQEFFKHPRIDLHAKDSTGETLLHKVARNDLSQAAEFLLQVPEMHTNMYQCENEHKFAPIHLCVHEKSFRVAAILLSKWDRHINERDEHGNSLLHMLAAAYISRTDASYKQILIKRNAMKSFAETLVSHESIDLNLCNSRGETPLRVAIGNNNLTVVEALLAAPDGKLLINQCDKDDIAEMIFSKSDVDVNDADVLGRTPLHSACYNNVTTMVQIILSRNEVNVNVRDKEQRTPLHLACLKNAAEVATLLLERDDVDVNAKAKRQQTPLHVALKENAADVAAMLIKRDDVNVNAVSKSQRTPLHIACQKNAAELATMILSRDGVNFNARDENQRTPLHFALEENAAEVAAMLIKRDDVNVNAVSKSQRTPLHIACQKNAAELAAMILSRDGVNVNAQDQDQRTPLHIANLENATEVSTLLLLRDDIDINARDKKQQTPLHFASWKNATEVAAMLIERDDVDVNARDENQATPLHIASLNNAAKVAAMLIKQEDVDVNARDKEQRTPLHLASWQKAAEVAAMLIKQEDVDVNARDQRQNTPLHAASFYNAAKVAAMLIKQENVDVNARDKEQRTPLHVASSTNAAAVTAMLIKQGNVDVNARDQLQNTPLHDASWTNAAEVAAMLIKQEDVDVNARNQFQNTPLHGASYSNAAKVAAMLIKQGNVDVNARDKEQRTPLHVASSTNAAEVAAMLIERDDVDVSARDKEQQTPLHIASLNNDAAEVATLLLSRDDVNVGARDSKGNTALELAMERGRTGCIEVIRNSS